ncbi:MAG: TonB-dependent receptor [Gemmatimonadaceae bacterium]
MIRIAVHAWRACVAGGALAVSAAALAAQSPVPTAPDTVRTDSGRAPLLAVVRVEGARDALSDRRRPWAVGTQSAHDLRRGQATIGVDEALSNIPGVVVSNRYNYAVDQRISIRGAGSRANFGLRGLKVLLDGVPQSLPDGQSQLTNIDLAAIGRVDVLRGAASSLYGNGSGGVIAFTSDLSAPDRFGASVRATAGSFGLAKTQARLSGRSGSTLGALSYSRTTIDGSRRYSAADTRQLMIAMDHQRDDGVLLALRTGTSETPKSLNPGALTPAEYAADRDAASPTNVNRGASKEVTQAYLSLRASRESDRGAWGVALYGQDRFLTNALAAPPPTTGPAPATAGTLNRISRGVGGVRLDGLRLLSGRWNPRVAGGLDIQRAADLRMNERTTGGRPTAPEDTVLLLQREVMTGIGPFAHLQLEPSDRLTLSVGGRWDRIGFSVEDRFLSDGADNSAERTMTAASGHLGAVWAATASLAAYLNVSTAFETPTTTELAIRPDGTGGFNPDLDPQRLRTFEVGARGDLGARVSYDVALFETVTTDAIVQYLETGTRAYFRNAGRTRNRGIELGLRGRLAEWLALQAAWTHADYRFVEYRIPGAVAPAVDTLDGNALGGVPPNVVRLGLRTEWRGFALDADHTLQGKMWADDRNTAALRADDWGDGVLNVRASWRGMLGAMRLEPFVAVQNALSVDYVGAVTLNGAFSRVLEPAPLRNWYLGIELGMPVVR